MSEEISLRVGAPVLTEAAIVLSGRLKFDARPLLERLIRDFDIDVLPFGMDHYAAASEAFLKYGKGRHPAALNLGDCLSYAIAKLSGGRFLYIGNDFSKTDLASPTA
jgi:ribonuclease VapC